MRHASPWYRASKRAWYVEHDGRQVQLLKLAPGEKPPIRRAPEGGGRPRWYPPQAVLEAFHRLKAGDPARVDPPGRITAARACDLFLRWAERHNDPKTFGWYAYYLRDFCLAHGRLPAAELKAYHVTRWLDAHPTWKGSRRHAVIAVKRAFNWAAREGLLRENPLKGVEKPPAGRRPAVLTREQRAEILAAIGDEEFRLFVEAMQESGARPSEVARVTAADVDPGRGVWVLREHKTGRKTGKPRVVYLTPRLAEITAMLAARHPEGPIFRGPRGGRPFTHAGIVSRFRRLRQKLPHLAHAVAYALRHGYATEALINGVGVAQVAELLGHRDTAMVMAHYSHLAEHTGYMREVARKAVTGG